MEGKGYFIEIKRRVVDKVKEILERGDINEFGQKTEAGRQVGEEGHEAGDAKTLQENVYGQEVAR